MRREIVALSMVCGMLSLGVCSIAQERRVRKACRRDEAVAELVEYIASRNEEYPESEGCLQDFSEIFTTLLENGVPADSSGFALLREWGVLTSLEYDLLLSHYKKFGESSSAVEYLLIPGIEERKMRMLLPILSFEDEVSFTTAPKAGFIARSIYRSGGISAYSRLNLTLPTGISAVVVAESDAGEKFPDYLSWSVQAERKSFFKSLIIGSYRAVAGQGVILSNAFPVNFSINPSSYFHVVRRAAKYTSADENRAFRGVAASFDYKSFTVNVMGSVRDLDARNNGAGYSSMLVTGVHVTESENESKDLLNEKMAAIDLSVGGDSWKAGVVLCGVTYSLPYTGRKSAILEMEKEWGQRRLNYSFNFRWSGGPLLLFGEAASDLMLSVNSLAGAYINGRNGNGYSVRFFYKDPFFVAPLTGLKNCYGNGRISGDIVGKVRLSGDTFIWFKSLLGKDYYNLSFKIRPEYDNNPVEAGFALSARALSGRMDYRRVIDNCVSFHIRGDVTLSSQVDMLTLGYAAHAELLYSNSLNKSKLSARITFFNIPVWDNRVYSYERDILYLFNSRVLNGKGLRWYLNYHSTLSGTCDLWMKYAGEFKGGDTTHELKIQLVFKMPLYGFDFNLFSR